MVFIYGGFASVVSQEFVVFRGVADSGSDHDGAYTGGGRRTVEGAGDGKNRDVVVAARQGVGGVDVGVVGCVERGGVGLAEEGGWRALAGLTHPDALMGGGHPMDVGVAAVAQVCRVGPAVDRARRRAANVAYAGLLVSAFDV